MVLAKKIGLYAESVLRPGLGNPGEILVGKSFCGGPQANTTTATEAVICFCHV